MNQHKTVNQLLIADFKTYLLERLENIRLVENDDRDLQQKLLYMSYLDGLASSRYTSYRNKKAFISLINDYSTWEHAQKICPLALKSLSDKYPKYDELKAYSNGIYDKMISLGGRFGAAQIPLDNLPSKIDLASVWPEDWLESNGSFPNMENLTHIVQLYNCRNMLVHSFQHRKESPYPRGNSDVIHYRQYMKSEGEIFLTGLTHSKFDLVHPTKFLYELCREITSNLVEYFIYEDINPFIGYYDHFGEY